VTACWGIVPAAGSGQRMNEAQPKQYLKIANHSLIEHSIAPLLQCPTIAAIFIALDTDDVHWQNISLKDNPRIKTCLGGANRAQSVYNALMHIKADAEDWVLVHDAVRPCLQSDDLEYLIQSTWDDAVGAILAIPINDSIKRVRRGANDRLCVVETLPRNDLWMRAATPQMFRYQLLCEALAQALSDAIEVDDEALAMQRLGHEVKIVAGDYRNIKVTYPADMVNARRYLSDIKR